MGPGGTPLSCTHRCRMGTVPTWLERPEAFEQNHKSRFLLEISQILHFKLKISYGESQSQEMCRPDPASAPLALTSNILSQPFSRGRSRRSGEPSVSPSHAMCMNQDPKPGLLRRSPFSSNRHLEKLPFSPPSIFSGRAAVSSPDNRNSYF